MFLKPDFNTGARDFESGGKDEDLSVNEPKKIHIKDLCRVPMFVLGICAQILVFGGVAFSQPTLALHLDTYEGFTKFWIGMYFAIPAIAYIVNTLLVSSYCKVFSRRGVIFFGLACFSISIFLLGTSPMLGIIDNPKTILTGLILLGFSAAMISIPLIPEVISSVEIQFPDLVGEDLNNFISGCFNSGMGVGEALGPIASGILVESYGFRMSTDLVGIAIALFTILFFFFNGNISLCLPLTVEDEADCDDNFTKYKDFDSAGPRTSFTLETDIGTTLHSEPAEQIRHIHQIPKLPLGGNRDNSLRLEI